ncbi:MAG: hypothetical protein AAGF58_04395 [Pseudomonadota bacterium]
MEHRLFAAALSFCCLLLLMQALPQNAQAQNAQPPAEFVISESGWQGGPAPLPDSDGFSHCGIERGISQGESFLILMNAEGRFALGVGRADWTLAVQSEEPAQVIIDGGSPLPVTAVAAAERLLIFPVGDDPGVVNALQQGNSVQLISQTANVNFPLTGTFRAIEALKSCVNKALEITAGGSAASAEPANRMTVDSIFQLMDAAGITGIALASPEEIDSTRLPIEQAWQIGPVRGALHQEPRGRDVALAEFSDAFVARFEALCAGTFASEIGQPDIIDNKYGVITSTFGCQRDDGTSHSELVVVLDDNFYSAFVHESRVEEKETVAAINARLAQTFRAMISPASE